MKTRYLDLDILDMQKEYLIAYKKKKDKTIDIWTMDNYSFEGIYEQMLKHNNIEILGVYKKLTDNQLRDIENA